MDAKAKQKLPLDPETRNPLLQNERLLNKLAKRYVSGGGTCDTWDLLNLLKEDGISANFEDAALVSSTCHDITYRLEQQSKGWEKLQLYKSSLSDDEQY